MLVALVAILTLLVTEMFIITKKFVATIDRYIRIPSLKVVIVNEIRLRMKLKVLGFLIRCSGKDVSVSSLADVLQGVWI
jgi:hypothetical protein